MHRTEGMGPEPTDSLLVGNILVRDVGSVRKARRCEEPARRWLRCFGIYRPPWVFSKAADGKNDKTHETDALHDHALRDAGGVVWTMPRTAKTGSGSTIDV